MRSLRTDFLVAISVIGCASLAHAQEAVKLGHIICSDPGMKTFTGSYMAKDTAVVMVQSIARVVMTSNSGDVYATLTVNGNACPTSPIEHGVPSQTVLATSTCQQSVIAGNQYLIVGTSEGGNSNQGNVCLAVLATTTPPTTTAPAPSPATPSTAKQ